MTRFDLTRREPLLLAGSSVRYLAQSAAAAGIPVVGIDTFADLDMRLACRQFHRAASTGALVQAVQESGVDDATSWSYAAGFECDPAALERLVRRRRNLLGNDPGVLQLLADARRFFTLLGELDIAHPRVLHERPRDTGGWLHKAGARFGGLGVRFAKDASPFDGPSHYQEFLNGPQCSLLFAADGCDIVVIGFNRLMARYPAAGDFRFAGAVSGYEPSEAQAQRMTLAAQRLTRALGLRGVNGLDFVVHNGVPKLLELNARPPATLELYEPMFHEGGLGCHLEACRGRLPELLPRAAVAGLRIVYARRAIGLGTVDWPAWASDRPPAGQEVAADAPLCTVHAQGSDLEAVTAQLRERVDAVHGLVRSYAERAA